MQVNGSCQSDLRSELLSHSIVFRRCVLGKVCLQPGGGRHPACRRAGIPARRKETRIRARSMKLCEYLMVRASDPGGETKPSFTAGGTTTATCPLTRRQFQSIFRCEMFELVSDYAPMPATSRRPLQKLTEDILVGAKAGPSVGVTGSRKDFHRRKCGDQKCGQTHAGHLA